MTYILIITLSIILAAATLVAATKPGKPDNIVNYDHIER